MSNPFETIETRLSEIDSKVEKLLKAMNHKEQPAEVKEYNTEQPLSQPEALRFLGRSRQTFYKWRKKNIITPYIIGGRIYYYPSELKAALKRLS